MNDDQSTQSRSTEKDEWTQRRIDSTRRNILKTTAVGAVLGGGGLSALTGTAAAQGLSVTDLTEGLTPEDLAQTLVADTGEIEIVPGSVTYTGADIAGGEFTGGSGIIGFEDGIILSSGRADDVVGPNESSSTSVQLGTPGDSDLSALAGSNYQTYDATILEFAFTVPAGSEQVSFNYVFGSEEYNEYVGSQFNDVFAFYINGVNCATVNGNPVSINTINNGSNSDSYIDNTNSSNDTEMDGYTTVLTCESSVDPSGENTIRLAIADTSDRILDSWVLLEGNSLTIGEPECPATATRLLAGQDVDVGTVLAVEDEDSLNVTYTTTGDWYMSKTQLHVAEDCDDIPQTGSGNPKVGRFELSATHDPPVQEYTFEVPLDSAWESGDTLCIAAHADVFQDKNDNGTFESDVDREETAWGEGDRFTERGNWAMHFDYEVC